jgi:hypothetical protein
MTPQKLIASPTHIQIESLLSLAMLTPNEFERLIQRLSSQSVLDDIVVADDAIDEMAFLALAENVN